jgi:effector-binding domain-containing protein
MMTWTSESQGSGSQEIVDVVAGKFMKTRLKFTDWDGETNCAIIIEEKGDSTKVSWTMDGSPIAFPFRGLMVVLGAQKSIEEDYTKGLNNLKAIVEAMPKSPAMEIRYDDMPALTYIGERMQLKVSEATQDLFDKTYAELEKTIKPGNRANYPRISIGHSFDPATQDLDLEIALPINEVQETMYKQSCTTIPAGKCVSYIHQGSYDKLPEVWGMFMAKVLEKYKPRFAGFEVYGNDPATITNESELLTTLVVPVE